MNSKSNDRAEAGSKARLYFIGNLRIFLTILVVLHHVAVTYGSGGSWYYLEHTGNVVANTVFSTFTSMNQMYFMGLFFLIAGYFTPASYNRKGFGAFVKDRIIRLGVPLLLFMFTFIPVLEYIKYRTNTGNRITFLDFYSYNVLGFKNLPPGHLWFIEALLLFTILYAITRLFHNNENTKAAGKKITLTNRKIIIFIVFLAVFTFLTRICFKMGEEVFHLQIAYFPQYISLFIIGILAYHNEWFLKLENATGRIWVIITAAEFLLLEIGLGSLGFYNNLKPFQGGIDLHSLFLSFHQAIFCVGMCISMLYVFRKSCDRQGRIARTISGDAYTVYIIHAPVTIFTALLIRGISLNPLLKFVIVSILSLVICFVLSHYIIRKITVNIRI